jgi:hypothetical protein
MRFAAKIWIVVVLAWLALMANTVWADDVPATAGAFAAYCTPLKKGCRSKITEVLSEAIVTAATSSPPTDACDMPEGIEEVPGDKAIIAWLSEHPDAAGMATADGINTATEALWKCQKSIDTGVTSQGAPDNTAAFVTFCADAKNYTKCANEVVRASVNALAAQDSSGKGPHCTSPDSVETKELTDRVLSWLKGHTEVYDHPTKDGTAAAIDHLWPCH